MKLMKTLGIIILSYIMWNNPIIGIIMIVVCLIGLDIIRGIK